MRAFATNNKESLTTCSYKLVFNFFPAYRRSGGRVIFIADDWSEVHIKLALTWRTKNYVGTIFGGSIYASIDPIYMMQLIKILGDDYVVWDKAATIKFIRPVRTTIYARFLLNAATIQEIRDNVAQNEKYVLELPVAYVDLNGTVYASATKSIYVASKQYYHNRRGKIAHNLK